MQPVNAQVLDYAGDIFDAGTDVFVNPWNRNVIPRWLLIPGGITKALKQRTGPEPWRDLAHRNTLALGEAVVTDSGHWDGADAIVHVAGINMRWRATPDSIRDAARNAIHAAAVRGYRSVMLPLIGAGHGGMPATAVRSLIVGELTEAFPPRTGARLVDVYIPTTPQS